MNVVDDEDEISVIEPIEVDEVVVVDTPTKGKRTLPDMTTFPNKKRRVEELTESPELEPEPEMVELD